MATRSKSDDDTRGHEGSGSHAAQDAGAGATGAAIVSERTPEQREQMAANSIGAQIILDYNGDGALGARGGAGGTIEENTMARDAYLVSIGLDPLAPSGPPPMVPLDQLQPPPPPRRPALSGKATRASSLAADILPDVPRTAPQLTDTHATGGTVSSASGMSSTSGASGTTKPS